MSRQPHSDVRIAAIELQDSSRIESFSDVSPETLRALGLISLVDQKLVDGHGSHRTLNLNRVSERIDEIDQWGELLVAQLPDRRNVIVGAMQASFNQQKSHYEIDFLAVDESRRKQGVGTALIDEAERHASARSLKMLSLLALGESVPFYDRLGFEITPHSYNGYFTPMVRAIKSTQ